MSSTPSPTASINATTPSTTMTPNSAPNSMSNLTRRPPRKSTLTQQQRNQKRQRATQDQLGLLEIEFNKNPTPTGATREKIASEINMTERSVQIWFQNRRAKIKLMAKKSLETGEDIDLIPETYRTYLAIQAHEAGKPFPRHFMGSGHPMAMGGAHPMMMGEANNSQKVVIHHFSCRSLNIGTWRRVGQNTMDLVVFYSLGEKPSVTYYINNESAGYKIEFPFSHIKSVSLNNQPDESINRPAGLSIELNRPPHFFMDSSGSGGFYQCGDFTENQQASQIMTHHLGGDPNVLGGQLAKLSLLESFQNRHLPHFYDPAAAMAMAAAQIPRPASQPNAMPPPPPINVFHDNSFGMSLQPGPRGHKRTRSRSVPAITDFSFLQHPIPSFHIQHPSTTIADPSIFAPIPQQMSTLAAGNNLKINTAHGYELGDYRQYPLSAGTTNSPSEYASPGFFGMNMEAPVSAGLQPPFTGSFLSPMPEHASPAPVGTPLSSVSHHDPIIADHSPPLSNIHRSASADFLLQDDSAIAFDDDTMLLSDMYQKHMQLPIRTGLPMSAPHTPAKLEDHGDEFDPFSFATVDPSNLQHGL